MTAIDYEKEYDNRARCRSTRGFSPSGRRTRRPYRAKIGAARQSRTDYGPTPRQFIDIFTATPDAPLAVFIHGGWWRGFDPTLFSHLAGGLNAHGISVALPGYDLCPQVGIADIIAQVRHAVLHLWRLHGKRMLVFGNSAGGHLTAVLMATDWPALAASAPADLVPAGYAISGVFDLVPLIQVSMNRDFRLNEDSAKAVSPLLWPAPRGKVLDAVVGGLESNEFLRQSRAIADAWGHGGAVTRYKEIAGANHFTVLKPLADPSELDGGASSGAGAEIVDGRRGLRPRIPSGADARRRTAGLLASRGLLEPRADLAQQRFPSGGKIRAVGCHAGGHAGDLRQHTRVAHQRKTQEPQLSGIEIGGQHAGGLSIADLLHLRRHRQHAHVLLRHRPIAEHQGLAHQIMQPGGIILGGMKVKRQELARRQRRLAYPLQPPFGDMGDEIVDQAVAQPSTRHEEHGVGESGAPSRQPLDQRVADLEGLCAADD